MLIDRAIPEIGSAGIQQHATLKAGAALRGDGHGRQDATTTGRG
ncbi:hypothetical protein [Sorangium sp. So ce233]